MKSGDKYILDEKLIQSNKVGVYYQIEHNYDLCGETLKIPRGCVLEFCGGSISNGTLEADYAAIVHQTSVFLIRMFVLSGIGKMTSYP